MLTLVKFGATNWTHLARTNIDTLITSSQALFGQKSRPALVAMALIISATLAVPPAHAQAQQGDLELKLRSLACDQFVPSKLSLIPQGPNLFGVSEVEWTRDLFGVLRERALSCAASASLRDRGFVKAWLDVKERTVLIGAENAVRARDAAIQNQQQVTIAKERRQAEIAAQERGAKN